MGPPSRDGPNRLYRVGQSLQRGFIITAQLCEVYSVLIPDFALHFYFESNKQVYYISRLHYAGMFSLKKFYVQSFCTIWIWLYNITTVQLIHYTRMFSVRFVSKYMQCFLYNRNLNVHYYNSAVIQFLSAHRARSNMFHNSGFIRPESIVSLWAFSRHFTSRGF